jgi:hypothetical protein
VESTTTTIRFKVKESLQEEVKVVIHESVQYFTKGKKVEPNVENPQHSHYEDTHSSHYPWGSPHSWNKVPNVDMHKFGILYTHGIRCPRFKA